MCESCIACPPKRFRLIAFDWDGTLSDSTALIVASIQAACRDLGAAVPDDAVARHVIGLGPTEALNYVAPEVPSSLHSGLAARYREHFLARDAEIPLFEGAREMLVELEARGFLLAIATGKSRQGLARALSQNGVGKYFVATRCADEDWAKPHPAMLLHLMEVAGVAAHETLMIGDTTHDLELAYNAGAEALAVAYGAHPRAGLEQLKPLAVVESVADLRRWLAAYA
jgi:phosphoglycolate phosphatase